METIKTYWNDFINIPGNEPKYKGHSYDWFSFGADSDKLAEWVLDGIPF